MITLYTENSKGPWVRAFPAAVCVRVYLFQRAGQEVNEGESKDDPQHPALPQ